MLELLCYSVGFSLILSVFLTLVTRELARRRKWVDRPGAHKQHTGYIPALGGVAVFLSTLVVLGCYCPLSVKVLSWLGAATLVAITGAADDLVGVRATYKLAVLGLASVLVCLGGWPTGLGLSSGLDWVASFLWVGLVSSSVNGIDNADGAAGGLSVIALLWIILLGLLAGNLSAVLVAGTLAGSLLGFLIFNFPMPKASIFLGDSGSLLVGLSLSCLSLETAPVRGFTGLLFASLILALPLFDFLLILIVRGLKGQYQSWTEPITMCARDHTYHRLTHLGRNCRAAVLEMYTWAFAVAVLALGSWILLGVTGIHYAWLIAVTLGLHAATYLGRSPLPPDVYDAHQSTR